MAESLNYRPNRLAQTLRTGKSGQIGILAEQGFGDLSQAQLYFAQLEIKSHGFTPTIYLISGSTEESLSNAVEFMLDAHVDGLVIFGDWAREEIPRIKEKKVPFVTVGSPLLTGSPRFYADKMHGVQTLVTHLLDQGCRKLTLLAPGEAPDPRKDWHQWCMIEGARNAIARFPDSGDKPTLAIHSLVHSFEGFMVPEFPHIHGLYATGYAGMKAIIEADQIPDALICTSDNWAHGAMLACSEAGLQIPKDLAISGFENDAISSAGFIPLTSVRQPLDQMLRLAVDYLEGVIQGTRTSEVPAIMLPCELIVRKSTIRKG